MADCVVGSRPLGYDLLERITKQNKTKQNKSFAANKIMSLLGVSFAND